MRTIGIPLLVLATCAVGCTGRGLPSRAYPPSFRLSQVSGEGDAQRRASLRLTLQGLGSDASGDASAAVLLYERAVQLDATNPWAYLAYARHLAAGADPDLALSLLEKAESLLADPSPTLDAHLVGLRGEALAALGQPDRADPLLDRARDLDPFVWDDGHLSAEELR